MYFKEILLAVLSAVVLSCTGPRSQGIPHASPEAAGMCSSHLALIDSAANASVALGEIPGAVIGIVHHGVLVYHKAFGYKSLVPDKEILTTDTMFDLASLSKCVGTTLSVMQLVERGQLRLVDPVSRYIPGFLPWVDPVTGDKAEITVQHLLTHSSGLDAYADVDAYVAEFGAGTPEAFIGYIATRSGRNFRPGSDQLYSCLNFVTLQHIVQRITGQRLCDYVQQHVFDVLGLGHTAYFPLDGNPVKPELAELCAPTEVQEDGLPLVAAVHDPIARIINRGNSGNAGVFSNVEDLAVIAAALLGDGSWNGRRILAPQTVRKMFEVPAVNDPKVARALGWDTYYNGPYTSGDIFETENLRGHTGYTGTSVILDPDTDTAVIILTNRAHPSDGGSVARLRAVVASIAAAAIR